MKFKYLFLVLIFAFINGCASYPKDELVKFDTISGIDGYQNKPTAFVNVRFFSGLPNENPAEMPQIVENVKPAVEKAFVTSDAFKSFSFDKTQQSNQDYQLELSIYNHGNKALAMISGFITGYTLGVIPGGATDNYTVKLVAKTTDGTVIKEIENKDAIKTWMGIWFLPFMGNTPEKAFHATIENQVLIALKELVESGEINYSHLGYKLNFG